MICGGNAGSVWVVKIPEMPEGEQSLLERLRLTSDLYREASAQARYDRENKKSMFAKMVCRVLETEGEMPAVKAQTKVLSSDAWQKYLDKLIETADKAAAHKMQMDNLKIEMEFNRRRDIQNAVERKYSRYG